MHNCKNFLSNNFCLVNVAVHSDKKNQAHKLSKMKNEKNNEPRIAPIEKPRGLFRHIMYMLMKKEFGKVIMPAKVIYARYPKIGLLVKKLYNVEDSLKLIAPADKFLIQNLVATLNGCAFCMDIAMKKAITQSIGLEKFYDLLSFENNAKYTEKEKAIFRYVKEMTTGIAISDDVYNSLKQHCSDEEIIEITYIAASENYLNRLLKPLNIGSDELCEIK